MLTMEEQLARAKQDKEAAQDAGKKHRDAALAGEQKLKQAHDDFMRLDEACGSLLPSSVAHVGMCVYSCCYVTHFGCRLYNHSGALFTNSALASLIWPTVAPQRARR